MQSVLGYRWQGGGRFVAMSIFVAAGSTDIDYLHDYLHGEALSILLLVKQT